MQKEHWIGCIYIATSYHLGNHHFALVKAFLLQLKSLRHYLHPLQFHNLFIAKQTTLFYA